MEVVIDHDTAKLYIIADESLGDCAIFRLSDVETARRLTISLLNALDASRLSSATPTFNISLKEVSGKKTREVARW